VKRHGCLIGIICIILSPILFILGFIITVTRQGIFTGKPPDVVFWLFTVLSIALFITGIVFIFIRSIEKVRVMEGEGEGEVFDYNITKCPYCNSYDIEGGVMYQGKTNKENQQVGCGITRRYRCLKCMAKWISVDK